MEYRGYIILKNKDIGPGADGLWHVPDLYYRDFANKIQQDFKTVSKLQCMEAIDYWYDFSENVKKIKD
jgi:hypothetical protein